MIALLAAVVILVMPGLALAQSSLRALEIDDFGFTRALSPGARPAGMAGAYTSLVNDTQGLVYNPAGLAAIKRIEVSIGAHADRHELQSYFHGQNSTVEASSGSLELASAAFPVAAIRGSLVGAAGVYRVFNSDLDLHYSALNQETNTLDNFLLQQSGSVYAYTAGFGVDLASALSAGASGFLLDGSISSLRQYDFTELSANPLRSLFVVEDIDLDVGGYGGRLGMMLHILPGIRAGVSFTTPVVVSLRGNALTDSTEHVDNAVDRFSQSSTTVETEYILPAQFDLGVSGTWRWITGGLDVGYTDWTTAAIDRRRLRNQNLDTMFREVVDVRVGVEATLPWFPARVRGGYALLPYPLRFLPTDRIQVQDLQPVSVDSERHQFAVGAGALVARVLLLDVSYSRTTGERSVQEYSQTETTNRFNFTASYRF